MAASSPPDPASLDAHRAELRRMLAFCGTLVALAGATYLVPQAQPIRPWLPGEPLPLVHLVQRSAVVEEDALGELVVAEVEEPAAEEPPPAPAAAGPTLPTRAPAHPTPLGGAPGALDAWFRELAKAEAGLPGAVVRTLHWGDSTIAGDGITMTVRDRLQARFGDAGPGFLAVHVDPRWALRPGIARWSKGDWQSLSITFGGAPQDQYGLAGTVAIAPAGAEASVTLGGRKLPDATSNSARQPVHRVDVYYQKQPGGGAFTVKPRGAGGARLSTESGGDRVYDAFHMLTSPEGSPTVYLQTDGSGPVTIYGVALETNGPGLTWESFGVAGSGQGSMLQNQSRSHLARQVERRQPHLLVYQTGGNELGYPSLGKDEGQLYLETYLKVLERLRAGAPDAACLVITPLDQATRERGQVISKPLLRRMVTLQEQAAEQAGCAFWDARGAMGGEGSFKRWLDHEPRLAWSDLMHLTDEGLEIIGHSLADALELAYDEWRAAHEAELPQRWVPPAPVEAPEVPTEVAPEVAPPAAQGAAG